ncbi:MAG: hypothetical protein MUF87_12280 [Anaerolineae bacterium]|jgi:deferrochelatase/peroxidase EfeB|nr:hypothetical protein [Anaerolineae bacterium]
MPANQFTSIVEVKAGQKEKLRDELKKVGNPLKNNQTMLQFGPPSAHGEKRPPANTYFARLVIIPGANDPTIYPGEELINPDPAVEAQKSYRLVFSAIFDGTVKDFFKELKQNSPDIGQIFQHCEGYQMGMDLYAYLKPHEQHPQIFYSSFLYETVQTLVKKIQLRERLQTTLRKHRHNMSNALNEICSFDPVPDAKIPTTEMNPIGNVFGLFVALFISGALAAGAWGAYSINQAWIGLFAYLIPVLLFILLPAYANTRITSTVTLVVSTLITAAASFAVTGQATVAGLGGGLALLAGFAVIKNAQANQHNADFAWVSTSTIMHSLVLVLFSLFVGVVTAATLWPTTWLAILGGIGIGGVLVSYALGPVLERAFPDDARSSMIARAVISAILAGIMVFGGLSAGATTAQIVFFVGAFFATAFLSLVIAPVIELIANRMPKPGLYGAVQDEVDAFKTVDDYKPVLESVGREDVIAQNQFNLYLTFKGDWFMRLVRLTRMQVLMFVLGTGLLNTPRAASGSLAGLTTVHFGHWIVIDGGRRLFFMTNYDSTWENYITDFVNKIHDILDIQLITFVGFSKEGTRNIAAFRRWLRRIQPQADMFYSAYPYTTVRNLQRDIKVNAKFPKNDWDDEVALNWLSLLADPEYPTWTTDQLKNDQAEYQTYIQEAADRGEKLTADEWKQIQSFIVYGYANLPHGRYLFLNIRDAEKAKVWLRQVADHVTTITKANDDDQPDRHLKTVVTVAFSYPAMEVLNLPQETLDSFTNEFREGIAPPPKKGDNLHPRSVKLGDTGQSAPWRWSVGNPVFAYRDPQKEIHLVLMITAKSSEDADALLAQAPFNQIDATESGIGLIQVEQGTTPPTGREPFGFRDGLSNPWIEGTRYSRRERDGKKGAPLKMTDTEIVKVNPDGTQRVTKLDNDPVISTGEFILGYPNTYGQLPSTPLVKNAHDPKNHLKAFKSKGQPDELDGYRDFGRNGSYLVYRKLQQDVDGLWAFFNQQFVNTPKFDQFDVLRTAAKAFGRWPSGVPLVMSPERDNPQMIQLARDTRNHSFFNDFRYRADGLYNDERGLACPFGAHIRRSHPRDAMLDDAPMESMRNTSLHRIMRRSAAFGELPKYVFDSDFFLNNGAPIHVERESKPGHKSDHDGQGIHFFGINANIQQQFEFIQQAWNNNGTFNGMYGSKDLVTGQHAEEEMPTALLEEESGLFNDFLQIREGKKAKASMFSGAGIIPQSAQRQAQGTPVLEPQLGRLSELDANPIRFEVTHLTQPDRPLHERLYDLKNFVTVRGGAYLFIPSLPALKFMTDTPPKTS